MKKIVLFVFTLSLLFSSCSKDNNNNNNNDSSEPKVYKVVSEASCLRDAVDDVSNFGMYIEFDSPTFTPIANKWYKDETGYFYFKISDITPLQESSQRILISQHYDTYCK
jgi:hypothetical protein